MLCDADGKLSVAAVADSVNGKELADAVLSWKIDVEEPTAASIISQALNKGHDIALRTTEWTALSVLRGKTMKASGTFAQQVAYKTVLDAVRMQLDSAAEDSDCIELFDFLVGLDVGRNSYLLI